MMRLYRFAVAGFGRLLFFTGLIYKGILLSVLDAAYETAAVVLLQNGYI